MEYVQDEQLLRTILEQQGILDRFETAGLRFRLIRYGKHELICGPEKPLEQLLFLVKGSVWVYSLREDGSSVSISRGVGRTVLGTMEFARKGLPAFYTETREETLCAALPLEENRAALEQDRVFLRFVMGHLAEMIITSAMIGHGEQPVEERLLVFLRDIQPDHALHGISSGLMQLHCSRRQLQRVVKKLCQEGVLERFGKGSYRLRPAARTAPQRCYEKEEAK